MQHWIFTTKKKNNNLYTDENFIVHGNIMSKNKRVKNHI